MNIVSIFRSLISIWAITLVCISTFWLIRDSEDFIGACTLVISIGIGLFTLTQKYFKGEVFTYLKVGCLSVVVGMYLFEGYVSYSHGANYILYRDVFDKVMSLRERGLNAYPANFPAQRLVEFQAYSPDRILPIGGVPDAVTVPCREYGPFVVYNSDRHGFNNPDQVWDTPPGFAFIGDSFTHGHCLDNPETFVGIFREKYPNTINLGIKGNGPLIEFAGLREYLSVVKPKTVFWAIYIGNDFVDLANEMKIPVLTKYRDPDFSQNLFEKPERIKRELSVLSNKLMTDHQSKFGLYHIDFRKAAGYLARQLTFHEVSISLRNLLLPPQQTADDPPLIFENKYYRRSNGSFDIEENRVLVKDMQSLFATAHRVVDQWKGKLVVVLIADRASCKYRDIDADYREVLSIAKSNGLDIIDSVPANCLGAGEGHGRFYSNRYSHYNVEGNRWLGNTLIDYSEETARPR